jgi:hypothetical protein
VPPWLTSFAEEDFLYRPSSRDHSMSHGRDGDFEGEFEEVGRADGAARGSAWSLPEDLFSAPAPGLAIFSSAASASAGGDSGCGCDLPDL